MIPNMPALPEHPSQAHPSGWKALGIFAAICAVLGAGVWLMSIDRDPEPAAAASPPATRAVHITLDGAQAAADITFATGTGTHQQTVPVPMTQKDGTDGLDLTVKAGTPVAFSAQMTSATGSLECVMTVDGVEVSRSSAAVPYGIVNCDATA